MRVMELQNNVKHGHLPFLRKDLHNFFGRIQRENLDSDAMDLLEYCKSAKRVNLSFQFDYTIDAENRLENIFWSPHCFELYQEYGDSTGFDTTYRVNAFDMPFGIFIGIDNHGRTILFGCALLRNETITTFRLLMKIDLAVEDIGQSQLRHVMLDIYRGSCLRSLSPLEEQVNKMFTTFSFKKFQEEFERASQYRVCEENNFVFIVQHYKELHTQKHFVAWSDDTISCSCKLFEFWGILCRHILSMFIHKDCFEIPMRYLPL
ncbi:hypothetical protein RND81_04G055400 [Saponaria officinalis]|uniref:SWIM-type domain-containing protein n=1 Tax=Saponaria officinalis TaxID=3572 RepID=A0AAW1LI61_SAPOF